MCLCFVDHILKKKLLQCAKEAGICYNNSAVHWANFIRDIMAEKVIQNLDNIRLTGEIEIEESQFGKKCKYNRGRARPKIWILGITERATNRIVLVPVSKRDAATRVPIIQKYVVDGAKIYTDGHKGYLNLNELPNGYEHFSCVHKEMKFSTCQLIMHDYKMKPSGSKYSIVV